MDFKELARRSVMQNLAAVEFPVALAIVLELVPDESLLMFFYRPEEVDLDGYRAVRGLRDDEKEILHGSPDSVQVLRIAALEDPLWASRDPDMRNALKDLAVDLTDFYRLEHRLDPALALAPEIQVAGVFIGVADPDNNQVPLTYAALGAMDDDPGD